MIDAKCWTNKEIRAHLEIARTTLIKMKNYSPRLFYIRLELRVKLLHCYIFLTLLYSAKAWTLKQVDTKKL